jgi:hypothetical protein
MLYCGIYRRVVRWKSTEVSEEGVDSVLGIEEEVEEETAGKHFTRLHVGTSQMTKLFCILFLALLLYSAFLLCPSI